MNSGEAGGPSEAEVTGRQTLRSASGERLRALKERLPQQQNHADGQDTNLAALRARIENGRPFVPPSQRRDAAPVGPVTELVQTPDGRYDYVTTPEPTRAPMTETERQAYEVYEYYFGQNWQSELKRNLLAKVASPTEEHRDNAGSRPGWVATFARVNQDGVLVANEIVPLQLVSEYALRAEIGEAVYNIMENVAVTGRVPRLENRRLPDNQMVNTCRQLLSRWRALYVDTPNSGYTGMNPDSQRDAGLAEWQSEGFADGIALEIKRRQGVSFDQHEQLILSRLSPQARQVLQEAGDLFLPPVQRRH